MARVLNFPSAYHGTLFEHEDGTPRRSWLWVEWEVPGGIKRLVEEYQGGLLRRYDSADGWGPVAIAVEPEIEKAVFKRLHKEARALQRYERGQYRDLLTEFEQTLLSLERECLHNLPHFHGQAVYQWIAEHPKVKLYNLGWRAIQDALANINDVMVAYYDVEMKDKLQATLLELRRVYQEVRDEQFEVAQAA
jgi:hypothetical protein